MDTNRTPTSVGLLLQRLSMGLFLLIAGIGKFANGLDNFYDYFTGLQPDWLPEALGEAYAYAIPFLEVIVGGLLILGLFTRITSWVSFAMVVSYTLALVLANNSLKHGPGPFNANFIMLTVLFLLGITGGGRLSIDSLLGKKKG